MAQYGGVYPIDEKLALSLNKLKLERKAIIEKVYANLDGPPCDITIPTYPLENNLIHHITETYMSRGATVVDTYTELQITY
jgi:hypothetical protein